MRRGRDSLRSRAGEAYKTAHEVKINIDQIILFIIMGFILIAVLIIGAITYHQGQLVDRSNCTALGGHIVKVDKEFRCIQLEGR